MSRMVLGNEMNDGESGASRISLFMESYVLIRLRTRPVLGLLLAHRGLEYELSKA